nr:gustatory receptor 9 [Tropidothorax elegans]UQW94885.1 gustatory receptor 7 [Tropidothorax elegans]
MCEQPEGRVLRMVEDILHPSRMFWVYPLKRRDREYVVSRTMLFGTAVLSCVYAVGFGYILTHTLEVTRRNSYITKAANLADCLIMLAVPQVAVVSLVSSLRSFNSSMISLQDAADLLADFDVPAVPRTWPRTVDFALILSTFTFGIAETFFSDNNSYFDGIFVRVYYDILLFKIILVVNSFTALVGMCSSLFAISTKALLMFLKSSIFYRAKKMEILISAHFKISESAIILSKIQSPQLMLIILLTFFAFISETYELYALVTIESGFTKELIVLSALTKSCWIIATAYLTWNILQSCVQLTDKAKEFNTLLYQLMIEDKTNDILNNKKLRLHITMKREVVFSACGFFNLDYSLVHSMAAAATTYLVILIQFGTSMTASSNSPANQTEPSD